MRPWYINYSLGPVFPTTEGEYPLSYCLHFFFSFLWYRGVPPNRWDHTLHARDIDYRLFWNRARVWLPFEPRHVEANEANYAQLENLELDLEPDCCEKSASFARKDLREKSQLHSNRTLSRLIFFPLIALIFHDLFRFSFIPVAARDSARIRWVLDTVASGAREEGITRNARERI